MPAFVLFWNASIDSFRNGLEGFGTLKFDPLEILNPRIHCIKKLWIFCHFAILQRIVIILKVIYLVGMGDENHSLTRNLLLFS